MTPTRAPYRRIPLWTTLVPLVAGIAVWAVLWTGYRRGFEEALAALLPAGTAIETGGFPYRLQARVAPLRLDWAGDALAAQLSAAEAVANRVPWQPTRTVLTLRAPEVRLSLAPIRGATVAIEAPAAQASLRTDGRRIARMSVLWNDPVVQLGWLPVAVRAERLEAHLRETPASGADTGNPRLPTQDQLVLSGTGVRFGDGDPLLFLLDSEVTADRPVTSLAAWAGQGTVEARALTLSDKTGEVARFSATLVPAADGMVRLAGTVETVCPQSVRAAFAGEPAPSERRTRRPERIPFTASLPGRLELAPADPTRPPAPVRGQQPVCPRLL